MLWYLDELREFFMIGKSWIVGDFWIFSYPLNARVYLNVPRGVAILNISDRDANLVDLNEFVGFSWFHSSDFKPIYCQWLIHFIILNILFGINGCWPFMMWYDFLSIESQRCLLIFVAIKYRTFLMGFTRCCDTWYIWQVRV